MRLLILGGTLFVGRHIVEAAQRAGHHVTLFNRGQVNAQLFPELEKLQGNRDGDLDALRGKSWDAVIDTCGYVPRVVKQSVDLLKDAVGHYTFISSISVFGKMTQENLDETSPVAELTKSDDEEHKGENYGPLKALCERTVAEIMPDRALIVRPGLIAGTWDASDRFTYWVRRIAQGGDVLAPGKPSRPVQFIDAFDLASWIVKMVESKSIGTYNATGPDHVMSMEYLLNEMKIVTNSDARLHWVEDSVLEKLEVAPWTELPLWIPESHKMRGMTSINCQKALAHGLKLSAVRDTIANTWQWDKTRDQQTPLKAGMKPDRERTILAETSASKV